MLTASQRARYLRNGLDNWPVRNVDFRLLYLKLYVIIEAVWTLLCKKVKVVATRDRNAYWEAEADSLEKMWQSGKTRDLYTMARTYSGKRRPAGILHLTDRLSNPLDSPEARMREWTREFK